jgi:hypothetical protein
MPTKKCSECNIDKDISEFNKNSRNKSGYKSKCRDCEHLYYLRNREKIIASVKKYDESHKEQRRASVRRYDEHHREERKQYCKDYRKKNHQERVRKDHEYYASHREQVLESVKKYSKSPQGRIVAAKSRHTRRSRNNCVNRTLTLEQWNKILFMQNGKCADCGKRFSSKCSPTKDHIIPLAKGGGLTFENTQALCKNCNCKKNDKIDIGKITTWIATPDEFKPDGINRRSEAQKAYWAKPGSREKQSEYQKKRYERPEEHTKLSEARKKVMESPIARKNLSDAKKKRYLDRQWYGSVKYQDERRLHSKKPIAELMINNVQRIEVNA